MSWKSRKLVVVEVEIPRDGNLRRKEHEKLKKYHHGRTGESLEDEGDRCT